CRHYLDIQKYNEQSLSLFWEEYMRTLNPEEYPVDLSQECWDHKMNYIQTVREQVEKNIQK
ncbi:nicotinate phosphoribosyltransferase, partial [Bacillus cereus]|nr:nicotinate phosphoribosyltransferase [Bacillus cereus]